MEEDRFVFRSPPQCTAQFLHIFKSGVERLFALNFWLPSFVLISHPITNLLDLGRFPTRRVCSRTVGQEMRRAVLSQSQALLCGGGCANNVPIQHNNFEHGFVLMTSGGSTPILRQRTRPTLRVFIFRSLDGIVVRTKRYASEPRSCSYRERQESLSSSSENQVDSERSFTAGTCVKNVIGILFTCASIKF